MHLARLYIKGYKSIKELDLRFDKGKNVLVGRNNSGKSNIVTALDLILGDTIPTSAKSDNVSENDFHAWKEMINGEIHIRSVDEMFIWCELQREAEEELNYNEIYKCYGYNVFSEIIDWVNNKPIKQAKRIPNRELPNGYDQIFQVDEDHADREYVNPKLRHQQPFEKQFDDKYHFAYAFRAQKDSYGQIFKDIRFLYRENEAKDWILGFKAYVRNELLQSAIIPSFRDPQNQLRLTNWTWYGKLMQHLTAAHAKSTALQQAMAGVKTIADSIFDSIRSKVKQSALEVAFPGTELHFQFSADSKTDLYKSCVIYVDDGFKSQLTEKGSGIQSATIIGLFSYYTQHVDVSTSALLCIEEPELYLHPHARRVISDRLDEFISADKNQVVLTTHSADFIRTTTKDLNIILVKKEDHTTRAVPVRIREFKNLLIDNNQNELFFADKVIVCEGHDEKIIRIIAKESFPETLDEQNVSIVSAGAKDNISQLVKLILMLGLKCFVMADFDYLLRDKSSAAKKYENKSHECVLNIDQQFFSQGYIFGPQAPTVLEEIKNFREGLKTKDEKLFYTAKQSTEIGTETLTKLLNTLRSNGICLLSGEIENLCKDGSVLSPRGKLNLDSIFKINAKLSEGVKIVDLFDITEITAFLKVVFQR